MIRSYRISDDGLAEAGAPDAPDAVWLDLVEPTDEERGSLAAHLGLALPSRADQEEIEQSSRLYLDHGVPVMTALLPARVDTDEAHIGPVTFILTEDRLVTLRHHHPRPFTQFPARAARASLGCSSALTVLLGLLEDIIDRLADITENVGREIDGLSREIFRPSGEARPDHQKTLRQIGQSDALVMHLRESLLTLERLLIFLIPVLEQREGGKPARGMVRSFQRDLRTIAEQAGFLQQKTALLLDATLGMIDIEQNKIIKIFSIAAVVFLPPTLIASIYGMNFAAMPELDWAAGYPAALTAMAVSAVIPLIYFKRKGWF
ncbi:magnesium transporter CorA family protein [Rhodovulum sp. YNF3179]|uniref:magnesium transporter CorA family protein n=1 Tax=Rhodovulum sp. YNF3179 TaxID=3425127 RepID=UPI003D331085